jgi:shikimate kinase
MNVILIGYRCTGKTTIGKRVAENLGIPFYDTDVLVERQTGRTILEIIEENGWQAFRHEEKAIIRKLAALDGCVIALGGGAILDEANVRNLKPEGLFVWLTADAASIIRRMKNDGKSKSQRPALSQRGIYEEVDRILAEREPLYRSAADMTVDTKDRTVQDIAEQIYLHWAKRRKETAGGGNVR